MMSRSAIFLLFVVVAYVALPEVGACGSNEVFKECSSYCERRCGEMQVDCIEVCEPPACQCKQGYCRNAQGNCELDEQPN